MSFGWSAGDIATALTLLYSIIEALDDVNGAADNYREAMGFLRDLKRTRASADPHSLECVPYV